MQAALRNDCIVVEQYCRPQRSCIAHALNRRRTADDRQSQQLAWAMAMPDLTCCYDRIIHNAAALVLLRLSLSHAKIQSMSKTVQCMVHRVRTTFGDSEITYVGFSYVNGCDLIQSSQDPLEVVKSMQTVVQQWDDLMEVTGGALNLDPSKSYWHMVEYIWKHGKRIASDADIGDFDLVARNVDNEFISLTRLNCDEESCMLGLWMSPAGKRKK